jgi:hypothetical protein
MYPRSVRALQADALFVSALRRSDELNASQIRRAVMVALHAYGGAGCAERVAQEFGDHPETAAVQMRWARATVAILEGCPVPRTRQMALIDSSASGRNRAMDDELIRVAGLATRVACRRMAPRYLKALSDSTEQVCCLPATFAWDRKATAYAEIVNLLADAAADPVLALLVRNLPGHIYELIVTVGPAADDIIVSSRRRLLALIRARDADGAGREMEQHLEGLSWTVERRCVPVREATL